MLECNAPIYFTLNNKDYQKQVRYLCFQLSKPALELTFLLILGVWLLLRKLYIITGPLTWREVFLTAAICIAVYFFSAIRVWQRTKGQINTFDLSIATFPNYLSVTNESTKQSQIFLFQDMVHCSLRPCGLYLLNKQKQTYLALYIPKRTFSSFSQMKNWHKYIRCAMRKYKKSKSENESLIINVLKKVGTFYLKLVKLFLLITVLWVFLVFMMWLLQN